MLKLLSGLLILTCALFAKSPEELTYQQRETIFERGAILNPNELPEFGFADKHWVNRSGKEGRDKFYFVRTKMVNNVPSVIGALFRADNASDEENLHHLKACAKYIPAMVANPDTNALVGWNHYRNVRFVEIIEDETGYGTINAAPPFTIQWKKVSHGGVQFLMAKATTEEPGFKFGKNNWFNPVKNPNGTFYSVANEIVPVEIPKSVSEIAPDCKKFPFSSKYHLKPMFVDLNKPSRAVRRIYGEHPPYRHQERHFPRNERPHLPYNELPVNAPLGAGPG